jgi:Gas vesicle protein
MSPDASLVDLLDRLLTDGVVVTGDITLAIADIDLVQISLRALITSITAHDPTEPLGPRSLIGVR